MNRQMKTYVGQGSQVSVLKRFFFSVFMLFAFQFLKVLVMYPLGEETVSHLLMSSSEAFFIPVTVFFFNL